jgi:hypothetical protein
MATKTLAWAGAEMLFRQNLHIGFADRTVRHPDVVRILGQHREQLGRVLLPARDGEQARYMPDPGQQTAFAEVAGLAQARGLLSGR